MTRQRLPIRILTRFLPLLLLAFAGTGAIAQTDPPSRVASLSHIDGSVAFAPAGETEWKDIARNRPITRGDRLWTDRGAKVELHAGASVLHVDGESFLDVTALDDRAVQASLNEGTVNARVRELAQGENFEIDTPQLAFRAAQPGDYRVDVDAKGATTRVTVRSGAATVYGANGQGQTVQAGQQVTFSGRELQRVAAQSTAQEDGFDRWAAERNRQEDQSIAARHVPREVVGYQQLDDHGTWAEDASYGEVWYPRVTVADWAPYRYGHWEWIGPWGWTWIDDAPWGFAPFHYGRWAMIGQRWAWVPGRIGPRPVYAPALVAFVGDGGWSASIGGPGIGWFPLAPGEAWRPAYRASAIYLGNLNRHIGIARHGDGYHHQRRPGAFTAVRIDDFSRGRPVHDHWRSARNVDVSRAQVLAATGLPAPQRFAEASRPARLHGMPPALFAQGFAGRTQSFVQAPGAGPGDWGQARRATQVQREEPRWQQQTQRREQFQRDHAVRRQQAVQDRVQRQQWQHQQQQTRSFHERPAQRQAEGFDRGARGQGHGHGLGRGAQAREEHRPQRDDGGRGHGRGRS